ncbi:NAD(P)-binding domain-containing protein [Desulfovibrio inopinatus]|uniref:NAD(P)-binding domain-containing protein n=1 Tax=Desulfovibrio inopinatus TaxID=102109 RepID=UPI0004058A5E|nr:NAD(P)-binding domain-containing protein [Desulfovibrio inopinatus]
MKIILFANTRHDLLTWKRLAQAEVDVVICDVSAYGDVATNLTDATVISPSQLDEMEEDEPRVFWFMLPQSRIVDVYLPFLKPILRVGDVVLDSSHSEPAQSQRRARDVESVGTDYFDIGTNASHSVYLVGGSENAMSRLKSFFLCLRRFCPVLHLGPVGSSHFAVQICEFLETRVRQTYLEGKEKISASPFAETVDADNLLGIFSAYFDTLAGPHSSTSQFAGVY